MRRVIVAVMGLSFVGCLEDVDAPPAEPPAVGLGALCLEAVPLSIDFVADHPNDVRAATTLFTTCDGSAFDATVKLDGEGFVVLTHIVDADGNIRQRGGVELELAAGEGVLVGVVYLARTIDDGAASDLVLRGHQPGAVGAARVALSGEVIQTCEQCGDCCDQTVPDDALTYALDGAIWNWRESMSDNPEPEGCGGHYGCED